MLHVHELPTTAVAVPPTREPLSRAGYTKWRRRAVMASAIIFMALLLALSLLAVHRHGASIRAGENGTFANDCCGTVELSTGKMLLNDQQTMRYIVSRDARGPYVLPRFYVGVVPYEGLDVDGTRSVLKLRLDRLPAPTRITLYEGLKPYVFTRRVPRVRAR